LVGIETTSLFGGRWCAPGNRGFLRRFLKKFLQGTRFYLFMTKQFVAVFPLEDSTHQMCHCDKFAGGRETALNRVSPA
jgi:hypothetical protein